MSRYSESNKGNGSCTGPTSNTSKIVLFFIGGGFAMIALVLKFLGKF